MESLNFIVLPKCVRENVYITFYDNISYLEQKLLSTCPCLCFLSQNLTPCL